MRRLVVISALSYLTVVVASAGVIRWRNWPTPAAVVEKGVRASMSAPDADWKEIPDVVIAAKPAGLWTLAHEYVRGPALIRFSTDPTAKWNYATRSPCTADGDMSSMISSQASIMPGAPVGALIVKIGGSSAGQSDGKVFLVGSFAVVEIDGNARGPIYLTINDEPSGMDNNSGMLTVSVAIKMLPAPAPPKSGSAQNQS